MELTFDVRSASKRLLISDDGKTAKRRKVDDKEAPRPQHDGQFRRTQVLCEEELTASLCYWEVEWSGEVGVAVVDGRISRTQDGSHSGFGTNKMSWSLVVRANKRSVTWNDWSDIKTRTVQSSKSYKLDRSTARPKLGLFLDKDGGTLTFYDVSSNKLSHIYTFTGQFKELHLYPGFWFKEGLVCLCEI